MGINVSELQDRFAVLDLENAFYVVGDFFGISDRKETNYDGRISNFYRVNILAPTLPGEFDILKIKIASDAEGLFSVEQGEMIEFLKNLNPRKGLFCQIKMAAYTSGERAEKSYKLIKICGVGS